VINRCRKANGHVFQGRYKAILLDGNAVGPVCHYIHLNPVQAGWVAPVELQSYSASSFHPLWYPSKRGPFFASVTALKEAGELREPLWERRLKQGLDASGKSKAALLSARKGCDWNVALARYLRESSLVPNR